MKKLILPLFLVLSWSKLYSQEILPDSLPNITIEEVIVISNSSNQHHKEPKALAPLDSYLEKSASVNMVKRGAYAWEPMLQGMATERSVITLDGMRIYGACTDKMDPITSYVEISNLSKAH